MAQINRRSFLKAGIAGTAGMVALSPDMISESSSKDQNIIYRTLGKTGMKVPVISFGVMKADNPNLCKAAYDKGIKLFDTANGYQGGNNETMLGNFFKDYPRDSFYVSTKAKLIGLDSQGKPTSQTSIDDFLGRFKTSLSRLKMDYVDILYIHNISNPETLEYKPIINALNTLKKEGKIKFMGFSTHQNTAAVISAAAESNNWDVILTSYNFKQSDITEMNNAVKKAAASGIGLVAMKVMAGGFLDKERTKPINTSAALKWVLSNPDIHTTIPGMTSFDQVDLNVKILTDISLTDDDKKFLSIATTETGLFCTGCTKCIPSCQRNLPVPDLMRAYMYAYGYSSPAMAHELLGELGTEYNPCGECLSCSVACTKQFDLKEKITDISRLVNVPADFLT